VSSYAEHLKLDAQPVADPVALAERKRAIAETFAWVDAEFSAKRVGEGFRDLLASASERFQVRRTQGHGKLLQKEPAFECRSAKEAQHRPKHLLGMPLYRQ